MKFDECQDCYFYGVEPAMCDECEDADQFEPNEGDDDAFGQLLQLSRTPAKVIPIRKSIDSIKRSPAPQDEELELCYA
jgi:hypothetical protein